MLNVWVPVRPVALGPPACGLHITTDGEIQKDFVACFPGPGTFLHVHGERGCLCGFEDWAALYAAVDDLMQRNHVVRAAIVHFWSGDRFTPEPRTVDPDVPEERTPIREREVVVLQAEPPEQRRHKRVLRMLAARVGERLTLRTKRGAPLVGVLEAFDAETEVGAVGGRPFVAAQILAVEDE